MDHTSHILITVASVVFTAFAFAYAIYRRVDLERNFRDEPEYADSRDFCNDQIFYELMRFGLHCLICGLIVWAVREIERNAGDLRPPGLRIINVLLNGLVVVAVSLGVKSGWNLWRRLRRLNRYRQRHALKV